MLAWKNERKGSTALLVKGARRDGKSTLVEQLAEQQYWAHDAQGLGTQCPSGGEAMPKAWGDNAQGLGSSYNKLCWNLDEVEMIHDEMRNVMGWMNKDVPIWMSQFDRLSSVSFDIRKIMDW